MNIAFFHELHFGGARRVVSEYANVFSKHHKIDLYYVDKERELDVEAYFNTKFWYSFQFEKYSGKDFLLKFYKDFIEPLKLYLLHKKIAAEIDKKNYDFVFVHPSQFTHAPFILRFLKTPTVYFCHEPLRIAYDPLISGKNYGEKTYYEKQIRKIKKTIDASNLKKSRIILANSKFSKKNIKNAYGVESQVCYLGINPKIFKPIGLKKIYDILFIGDEVWMEGYDTLQDIKKFSRGKLSIKIVKPKRDRYISDKMLSEEYNKSKILIALGRFDPFSMLPWEAMACSVPAIVVNEGGIVEAVRNEETGLIIVRDPVKLLAGINYLLNNTEIRDGMGMSGRKDVLKNWTWERSYERVMKIISNNL